MAFRGVRNEDTTAATRARQRKVVMISRYGIEDVYPSIKVAARRTGFFESEICQCCKGKRNDVRGYEFKYYEQFKQERNSGD